MFEHVIAKIWNRVAAARNREHQAGPSLDLGLRITDGQVQPVHVQLPQSKRPEHIAILEKTGQGKSYFLRHLSAQDIRSGRGFVFFDLHGDTMPFLLRVVASEERRQGRDLSEWLIVIEPGDSEFSIGLNVLEKRDDNQNTYVQLAEFAQILKRAGISILWALEADSHFVRGFDGIALCEDALGNWNAAEENYRTANALNREQGSPFAWPPLNYGSMLLKVSRYAEAKVLLNEALKIDPSLAKAYYELGRVEEQTSNPEAALADFRTASSLDPNDPSTVYALFRLYKAAGKEHLAAITMARFRDLKAQQSKGSH